VWFTFTVPATYIIGLISGIALCYCTLAICNGTVCFQVLWQLWCLQLIHCLYSCLWILVTCHDVTAIWLLGYFTRIMQYGVSTEFVHGWIAVLWHSHTQLQCERWHVVTTGHTHTVINILIGCAMAQAVTQIIDSLSPWRPGSLSGHYTWYW